MSPLIRRRAADTPGVAPRRTPAGVLRRERRALLKAREDALRDLGGLLVEMYRRGGFRDDLLQERSAAVVGIDARLGEIESLLHGSRRAARCACGAPLLRGSRFCPNCGRSLESTSGVGEETVVAGPDDLDRAERD